MSRKMRFVSVYFFMACQISFLLFAAFHAMAEETVCAKVKIEINQELTLERQAFDAHMRITNGLPRTDLENIKVRVWFEDEEGNAVEASSDSDNTTASFFIRIDEMDNIEDVSGSGVVSADTSADIHWLIIPAPGSSNGEIQGKKYNVGASLVYSVGGEEETVEVTPDYIYVKPMPELSLDYFLPEQVYGDDPFTDEIEACVPFYLGVRVKNSGDGSANQLKIESAQPKIVDNDQGLLIDFKILGAQVNDQTTSGSLLVDFGIVEPGKVANARWEMSCELSGKFEEFTATYTHGDELGGELTSLLKEVKTHTLVQCVLVDLPNRDSIKDFLSKSDGTYKVYESETLDTEVKDVSGGATLSSAESTGDVGARSLTFPASSGFVYACLPDPYSGIKVLQQVIRSDGKEIKLDNAWLSKTQNIETHQWSYFINIFDADTTGSYTLFFSDAASMPQAPVLQFIPDKSVAENQQISFIVEASDPNGRCPVLSAFPLPAGAVFVDNNDGTGIFDWTPAPGQAGTYNIIFKASDGTLSSSRSVKIIVYNAGDTDMDGMEDDWELEYFDTLSRDGSGDFDGDGVTDAKENCDGTDPTCDESVPSVPVPVYPHQYIDVAETDISLVVETSVHTHDHAISYQFELYSDEQYSNIIATGSQNEISITQDSVSWQIPVTIDDNTQYYWRARSVNNFGPSLWVNRNFFLNRENDPPGAFSIAGPADDTSVDTAYPVLTVMNATDTDGDELTYTFEIFLDDTLTQKVVSSGPVPQGESGTTSWQVTKALIDTNYYFWRVTAADKYEGQTHSFVSGFFVNTLDKTPTDPVILSPGQSEEIDLLYADLRVENAVDQEDDPIEYYFEIDCLPGFDSSSLQMSGPISSQEEFTAWQAGNLVENTQYFWRVKACDSSSCSQWASSKFFVNTINEAPSCPMVRNPGITSWTNAEQPVLSLFPVIDPDLDSVEYQFEIYNDQNFTDLVYQGTSTLSDWTLPTALENNSRYYWRARIQDEHGVSGTWTEANSFFLKTAPLNSEPSIEIAFPGEDTVVNTSSITVRWFDDDHDDNALISLFYATDDYGANGLLIAENIQENLEGDQDSYVWDTTGIDDGTYYFYARISDDDTQITDYSSVSITIDRTPPVLTITPEDGEYDAPLEVEIISSEACDIFYTLDGAEPGPGSNLYNTGLVLTESTVLNCKAIDSAGNSSDTISRKFTILSENITLSLTSGIGIPISSVKIYLFTESGMYTGISGKTDENGISLFDPDDITDGLYKFRIDWLGHKFWTDTIALPETRLIEKNIPVETVLMDLSAAQQSVSGSRVYLFSETGTYLGVYQLTDDQGQVSFDLPVGVVYKFRADVLGSRYWTDPFQVEQGDTNDVSLDTGGGVLTATLQTDEQTPITDIKLYLFNPNGSYLGKYQTTGEDGRVSFEVPRADYKIRADYLGYKFWTDAITVEENTAADLTIPHKAIVVTISGLYQQTYSPIPDIKAYLFSASGTYLRQYSRTDNEGKIYLSLPDREYKLRADYIGQEFWSSEIKYSDTDLNIPMAKSNVSVTGAGLPEAGLKVYLFSDSGTYLKQNQTTGDTGRVDFEVPEGLYKFRADYQGSHFWSPVSSLAAGVVNSIGISVGGGEFTFTGLINSNQPLSGVNTYVFSDDNTYTGLNARTDTEGKAFFDLADGDYYFRLDYMGTNYWSDLIPVPAQLSHSLSIPHEILQITLSTRNEILSDNRIYLFSQTGKYLGLYKETDENGVVEFTLPVGLDVQFRADVLGHKIWSDAVTLTGDGTNYLDFDTGGGSIRINLKKDDDTPICDTKIYLFTSNDAYTGLSARSDANGSAYFEVPEAQFKFRADYLGYQFWKTYETVSDDTIINMALAHQDISITLEKQFQGEKTPLNGIRTYIFTPSGSYVTLSAKTDEQGQSSFFLPDKAYKARADYMGYTFWTEEFQFADALLTIPHGEVKVIVSQDGSRVDGAKVHLFRDSNSYLGKYLTTGLEGEAVFQVPGDRAFKFRVDTGSLKVWTDTVTPVSDQITTIEMDINQ